MIFYIANEFGRIGGAQKSAADVLINLLATNHQVTVLTYNNKIKLTKELQGKVINQCKWIKAPRNIPFPKQITSKFPRNIAKWIIRSYQDLFLQNNLNITKKLNPDLIFVNSLGGDNLHSKCYFSKNNKSIMILRESPSFFKYFDNNSLNLESAIKTLEQYSAIIFVSSIVRDKWLSFKTLTRKKAFYIPNCCEEDKVIHLQSQNRMEIRKYLGIPNDRFIAVCVATIQNRKGQDILVSNFNKIKKIAPDIILYFVGNVLFPWGKDLVKHVKSKYFGDSLQILGNRSNALEFIYAADLLILPTRAEALPRVILEAMALKTPVLASDVDGIPELIKDEVDGLLFPADNSEKMIETFERIYKNEEERKKLVKSAEKKYWANFSRSHQIKRYANVIKEMSKESY